MATISHTGFLPSQAAPAIASTTGLSNRRRSISPRAGRALEILGHAIEYLADEYIHAGGALSARNPQLQALQLMMAVNRQIYMECPEVPTLRERLLHFLDA